MARPGPKPRLASYTRRPPGADKAPEWPVPPHLGEIARGEFIRLVRVLRERGTLVATDPGIVEAAATCYEAFRIAQATLDEDGLFLTGDHGLRTHPGVKVVLDMTGRLRQVLSDLGLTPKTSLVGGSTPSTEADKWGDLLDGM